MLHGTPHVDTCVASAAQDRDKLSVDISIQKLTENTSGAINQSTITTGGSPSDNYLTGSTNESQLATGTSNAEVTHSFAASSFGFWAVTVAISVAVVGVLLHVRHGH